MAEMDFTVELAELDLLVKEVNKAATTLGTVAQNIPAAKITDLSILGYASEAQQVGQAWNKAVEFRLADAKKLYSIVLGISIGVQGVAAEYEGTDNDNSGRFDK